MKVFPDAWHVSPALQQVLPQHSTPGGQQRPMPLVDKQGTVLDGQGVHLCVDGLAQVCPAGQQTPPQMLLALQHLPLMHCDPTGQQVLPHIGWSKPQQEPVLGSRQLDSSSQQVGPQMLFELQQEPLWQVWPLPQQTPLQEVTPGSQHTPPVQTWDPEQQSLPHTVVSVGQPQVPSDPHLGMSVPQQTSLQTAAPAGQHRRPPSKLKQLSPLAQVVKEPHGLGRHPPPGRWQ